MYLYDKKEKSFTVYELQEDKELAKGFRETEMKKAEFNKKLLYLEEYEDPSCLYQPIFKYYKDKLEDIIIDSDVFYKKRSEIFSDYYRHLYINYNLDEYELKILEDYYLGVKYSKRPIMRIFDRDIIKYYLLTHDAQKGYNSYWTKRIIEIPESLYLLQNLEQQKFNLLDGADLSKQLTLFDLKELGNVSFEELQRMDTFRITRNAYNNTLKKSESADYVLKLIKDKKKSL